MESVLYLIIFSTLCTFSGTALSCMLKFFQTLVDANLHGLTYRHLLQRLTGLVYNARVQLHKQVGKFLFF